MKKPVVEFKSFFGVRVLQRTYKERFIKSKLRGRDNVDSVQFGLRLSENIRHINKIICEGKYKYIPYLELLKSKGKARHPRVIAIPSLRDRLVLNQIKEYLVHKFNDECKQELANTIVNRVVDLYAELGEEIENKEIVKIDVKEFYDGISHEKLISRLKVKIKSKLALELIEQALKTPCVPKKTKATEYNKKGVHQGLATSNVLASIYLNDIDVEFSNRADIKYFRYVDDVLIICDNGCGQDMYDTVVLKLKELDLFAHSLGTGKSTVQPATSKFEYLGYSMTSGLVSVRKSSEQRFIDEIAKMVTRFKYRKHISKHPKLDVEIFLEEINEKITGAYSEGRRYGWVAFYSQVNDANLLGRMDYVIRRIIRTDSDLSTIVPSVKFLRRSIYEMRYRPDNGYVFNYDSIITIEAKKNYLIKRGAVDEATVRDMTRRQVEEQYDHIRSGYLSRLELDEALRS